MNGIVLYNALTRIDETLIAHAVETPARPARVRRPARLVPLLAGCACLVLICGVALFARFAGFMNGGKGSGVPHGNGTTATALTDYTALLYANGMGGEIDTSTPRYEGNPFGSFETYKKEGMKPKTVTLFGKTVTLYYSDTVKAGYSVPFDRDFYEFFSEGTNDYCLITFRSDTGKIATYQTSPSYRADYASPVSADSTDEEFLTYANAVLAEYAGVSTEGWETAVGRSVRKWKSGERYVHVVDGRTVAVSESEYETLAGTYVKITYTKKIGGIDRCDRMTVEMTDAGEIVGFGAINCEDGFKPFLSINPDRAKIEEAAWRAFGSSGIHGYSSASIWKIELFASENSLWAVVSIHYKIGEANGGVQYAIEVARIE